MPEVQRLRSEPSTACANETTPSQTDGSPVITKARDKAGQRFWKTPKFYYLLRFIHSDLRSIHSESEGSPAQARVLLDSISFDIHWHSSCKWNSHGFVSLIYCSTHFNMSTMTHVLENVISLPQWPLGNYFTWDSIPIPDMRMSILWRRCWLSEASLLLQSIDISIERLSPPWYTL